jgi:hypothetical protein
MNLYDVKHKNEKKYIELRSKIKTDRQRKYKASIVQLQFYV